MRVAVIDSGFSTSWGLRLAAEGCDVRVYVDAAKYPGSFGEGFGVHKETSYDRLVAWIKESPTDTIALFCQDGDGDKADELRRSGIHVVGAGSFCDKLEEDREFGQDVAREVGLHIPEYEAFPTLSEAIDARRGRSDGGVFKTNQFVECDATQIFHDGESLVRYMMQFRERYRDRISIIIQELIGGNESSDFDIERWFDGKAFLDPFIVDMEKKRFLNDDLGPSTGCSLNAVWFDERPSIADEIDYEKLAELFVRAEAPPGLYAVNTRLSDEDGKAYFLEWTPRLGLDSEPTSALLVDSLSDLLWRVASGEGGTKVSQKLAYSIRLTIPPYPAEHVESKRGCTGIVIPYDGNLYAPPFLGYQVRKGHFGLECGSDEGVLGLAAAVGDDLSKMHDQCIAFIEDMHKGLSGLQARTDGARVLQSDARKLEALGVEVHPAILKSAEEEAA